MSSTTLHFRKWAASPSNWLALLLGLGLVGVFAGSTKSTAIPKIIVGTNNEVVYFHRATKDDALALGRALKDIGYFTDQGAGVVLDKRQGGTTISFVVSDTDWSQPNAISDYGNTGRLIAPAVGGFPLQVRLLDGRLTERKSLTVGKQLVGMRDTIYYYGSATAEEAQKLGQSLRSAGALRDTGMTVVLAKGDVTSLSFVVNQAPWERPEAMSVFETLTRQVAPTIGGLPVKLRFLDTTGRSRKEVSID